MLMSPLLTNPFFQNEFPQTKQADAAMRKITLVDILINAGANISDADINGRTPLHRAVRYENNTTVVEALILREANVSCVDINGRTPLHRAVRYGNMRMVETLIDLGAGLLAIDRAGQSPLECAKHYGHDGITKLLTKRSATAPMPVSSNRK